MTKFKVIPVAMLMTLTFSVAAFAEEAPVAAEPAEIALVDTPTEAKDNPKWVESLKTKYSLTQADIDAMSEKKIAYPQMAMVSELALKSGKTRDEVIAMRVDQKMGWGKIAKTLGVAPGTIGQAVSSLHNDVRGEKLEKREEKMAKREEKVAKREEKAAKREAKRAEREAKKK